MRAILIATLSILGACGSRPVEKAPEPQVRITQFYGATDAIGKGDSVTLCYGTDNAVAVKLEPYSDSLKPSLTRCIADTPLQDTTYTLTATGANGATVRQTFQVKVGPPTPKGADLISEFNLAGDNDVAPGSKVRFCYHSVPGVKLTLTPPVARNLKPGRDCFSMEVQRTTTLMLTATAASGAVDRIQNTIRVK